MLHILKLEWPDKTDPGISKKQAISEPVTPIGNKKREGSLGIRRKSTEPILQKTKSKIQGENKSICVILKDTCDLYVENNKLIKTE